jgi:hypothetical protein
VRIRVDQVQIEVSDRARDQSREWARRLSDQGARIDRGVPVNPSVIAPPVEGKSAAHDLFDGPDAAATGATTGPAEARGGHDPPGRSQRNVRSGGRGGARSGGDASRIDLQARIRRQREALHTLAAPAAVMARMPRPGPSPAAVQAQSDFLGACLVVLPRLESELERLDALIVESGDGRLAPEDEAVLNAAERWVSFAHARLAAYFNNAEGPELASAIGQSIANAALLQGVLRVVAQDEVLARAGQGFAVAAGALVPPVGVEPSARLKAEQRLYSDTARLASRFGEAAGDAVDHAREGPRAAVLAILMAQIAFLSGTGDIVRGAPRWMSLAPLPASGLARMASMLRRRV